jgi:hypothetical protein
MQDNEGWIEMFRRIPGNLHETLSLGTISGAEILLQRIIKLESDFMILRGRLAGTQDNRVMMLPYHQLTFVMITRPMKEPEVEAIFGKADPPPVADLPAPAAAEEKPAEAAPLPPVPPPAQTAPTVPDPARKPPSSKSVLVAKLRERLKNK